VSAAPSAFDLYVSADDFHVLKNAMGELSLDADLHAMGDLNRPLLVGTIKVERGRLEVDDLLERFGAGGYTAVPQERPATADLAARATPVTGPASAASQASYSIALDLPDNVVVRGRDLHAPSGSFGLGDINATLGGALVLAKESGEPITLRGRLEVVRGQYTFQGRRFTIDRGSEVIFRGESTINPALNVTAERQIGGVTARVRVTGTSRRPQLALSSTPALDQADVLSLIVFNSTMNELPTGDRINLASRAGTLAARALATPLADSVMRALDFDLFEITPNEDVSTGASLAVGRQVNERLFVGFRQTFGSDDVSQVSFEIRLTEFLRLVTTFAQGADRSRTTPRAETAGLDLFFVIRR
jgi:autotransporter translocation and assembly factor TamB